MSKSDAWFVSPKALLDPYRVFQQSQMASHSQEVVNSGLAEL